ncbi:MAG: polyphosphate kinase [Acidimicrobiia bacterium]
MAASPHMLTAWADTSRENGEGGRNRGSVAILGPEGTAGDPGLPAPTAPGSPPDDRAGLTPDDRAGPPRRAGRSLAASRGLRPGTASGSWPYDGSMTVPTDPPAGDLDPAALRVDPARFINRELSWLDFNARVLALAEDLRRPLLERAKFLAIFAQNLDEFFQVRVSGLQEQYDAGLRTRTPDGLDAGEQLRAVRAYARELVDRHTALFNKDVAPALEDAGIRFASWAELTPDDRAELGAVFEDRIFPVLTPLAVDPAHPFPYISNLSLNLAVLVREPRTREERFARVKVPPVLPRFVPLTDGNRFVPIEQVIAAHLDRLFPGMDIVTEHPFRVTRDADFELDDEDEDLLEAIEEVLHRRTKFGQVVRLEIDSLMPDEVRSVLQRELEIDDDAVTVIDGTLDLSGLWGLVGLDRPDLKDEPWTPQTPLALVPTELRPDIFEILRHGDVLVHHPYDSFATSVEAFIEQAAQDPRVLAIKQTIYRTAGTDSAIVRALTNAAREGKQVVALVELKARFDEEANIERARVLEEAGVHVVYGLVGLKTHAKILLVVRQEDDGIRRYCHVGTGNYNPKTATLYEDLGLLTANPEFGAELTELFNHLTGYSRPVRYRHLLVAPEAIRTGLAERIRAQAALGADGRIVFKMNSLVDPGLIDELYDASSAGTPVDLVVRGICCLRPQVPGLSDHIRVRSLVGRYLEHSRVYRFGADPATAEWYFGSADLMPRNLDRRVEALAPVHDPALRERLEEMIRLQLTDTELAWELRADGTWGRVPEEGSINAQRELAARAVERAHRT